jgi:hypothetical protein
MSSCVVESCGASGSASGFWEGIEFVVGSDSASALEFQAVVDFMLKDRYVGIARVEWKNEIPRADSRS